MSAKSEHNKGEQDSEEIQAEGLETFGETGEAQKFDEGLLKTIGDNREMTKRGFLGIIGKGIAAAAGISMGSKMANAKGSGIVKVQNKEHKKLTIKEALENGLRALEEENSYQISMGHGSGSRFEIKIFPFKGRMVIVRELYNDETNELAKKSTYIDELEFVYEEMIKYAEKHNLQIYEM